MHYYIFNTDSFHYRARMGAIDLVGKQWFDNVVLLFILLNCIIMAMERPSIKPDSTERKIIDISNHVFTVVFTIEMCIKVTFTFFAHWQTVCLFLIYVWFDQKRNLEDFSFSFYFVIRKTFDFNVKAMKVSSILHQNLFKMTRNCFIYMCMILDFCSWILFW